MAKALVALMQLESFLIYKKSLKRY